MGSKEVNQALSELENNSRFTIFPSLRFEYFLTLLKNVSKRYAQKIVL